MRSRSVVAAVLLLGSLLACGPAEETSRLSFGQAPQALEAAPAFAGSAEPDAARFSPDPACADACGRLPWCAAVCRADEDDPFSPRPFAQRAMARAFAAGDVECIACGRETGFSPRPVEVAVVDEGEYLRVMWTAVAGASEYEVLVSRSKGSGTSAMPVLDIRVLEPQSIFAAAQFQAEFSYIFTVAVIVDGEVDVRYTGTSAPFDP